MEKFIQTLRSRYASMLQNRAMDAKESREATDKLNALRLAESVLRKLKLNEQHPQHAWHIGILGPTQSGKSTLVNLLFSADVAGVSALAGYTVHAQGFVASGQHSGGDTDSRTNREQHAIAHHSEAIFTDFEQVAQKQLQHENYKQYSVETIDASNSCTQLTTELGAVIWDSPDFDSIESGSYRSAVLRVAAIADTCVLMVSKDKYADKSVWDLLALLQPLQKPLIVCINKLNDPDTDVVINSFVQRYKVNISAERTPIVVPLPYVKGLDKQGSQIIGKQQQLLYEYIRASIDLDSRKQQRDGAWRFIQQHWLGWLEPVLAEQNASRRWEQAVDKALSAGMQRYREGYLDHPQKYDTFNLALAELLVLLEIPGLAGALGTTRKIVTWPMKKLLKLGQNMLEQTPVSSASTAGLEEDVLLQAAQHVFSQLNNVILDAELEQPLAHWWTSLSRELTRQQRPTLARFSEQTEQHQILFKPQIDAAAHKLYGNLQQQPAILNSLRAARVSTDAAAVVLAVHSGGLAASDLVLAPAMLSLTTLLTESALGKYMDGVKADLKSQQALQVRHVLFDKVLGEFLYSLPQSLGNNSGLLSITESDVEHALVELQAQTNEH